MRSKLFLVLSISLIISGCGSKSEDSTSTIYLGQGESINSYTQSLSLDSSTPEGVGTLLTLHEGKYTQRNVGLCTWFLVDKKHAITNSHCIPDSLKKNKSLACGEYLQGAFKTRSDTFKVKCKKLIYFSDISQPTSLNNDYALLELERSFDNSSVFKLDRRGVVENEKIKILTMNHHEVSSGIYSEYKVHHCIMKSSDVLGKISSAGSSPLAGFKEDGTSDICKTIQGNSGSPVIDEAGRLIGVLHGGIKQGLDLNQGSTISSSKVTDHLSIFTNLRCQRFNDSALDSDYPEVCKDEKLRSRFDNEKILKELEPKISKLLEDALKQQPAYLEYNLETKSLGAGSMVSIHPKCIKPLITWDEKNLKEIVKEGFFSKKKSIKAVVEQYQMDFLLSLNYYGNFKLEVSLKTFGALQFNISGLHELDSKKEVTSVLDTNLLGFANSLESKIRICQPAIGII